MNPKHTAVAGILLIVWLSWFFRYDLSDGPRGLTLDRWSGTIITSRGNAFTLGEAETPEQHLARLWRSPELYVSTARRAGYSDTFILEFWAQKNPRFDLAGARAAGYSDQEILDGLAELKVDPQKKSETRGPVTNVAPPNGD